MSQSHKTDNAFLESKLALRRHFLSRYHADRRPYVMDCCAGSGVIWSSLRGEGIGFDYWQMDLKPKKGRLKLDSVRVLQQAGWPQDCIDVDTYGSPWKHWMALLPNVSQPTTVFLTIGLVRMGGGGNVGKEILETLGLRRLEHLPQALAAKASEFGLPYMLAAAYRHGLSIVEAAESTRGLKARYVGVRLEPAKKSADFLPAP